jgi:tetratricopeptide (TPR) repeat protein
MAKTVFISSTSLDLKDYRQAAIDTCTSLGFVPIVMENFEAMGVGATEGSKRKLKEADLYVGIIAHRYGYIEQGYNHSVTEIEFDYAGERGLERLCFMVDPGIPWPADAYDHANAARLNAFKGKINKSVIRALFMSVDDFQNKLLRALVNWQEWRAARSGELDAILATTADDIPNQPEKLVGRAELVTAVNHLLDRGKRVLLQGFGGVGKTALAAAITAERLNDDEGPVLWLRAGAEDRDGLFLAMVRAFDAQHALANETSIINKARIIRLLLLEHGVKLVVLDDAWNGRALHSLLNVNAIPRGVPVLVTSRHRFAGLTRLDVDRLDTGDALALLAYYGQPDWVYDPDARALCHKLGNHAFAVRVAGMTLALDDLTPNELLTRIAAEPHKLAIPDDYVEEGQANIEDLLNASLYDLDFEARSVFMAFGALFTPTTTPEMLSLYLGQNISEVEEALNRLQRRGLAERIHETPERTGEFRIHDLAYSYARAQANEAQRNRGLDTCLTFLDKYHEPKAENFPAVRAELDNFIGGANWALSVGRYMDVTHIADHLYRQPSDSSTEGFLHLQGYARLSISLLSLASSAAEALNQKAAQARYLGHLGSAYRDSGQIKAGMKHYRTALRFYRELNDRAGVGITLGRLGIAYRLLGQAEPAINHLEQALAIAREVNDPRAEGINLANLGIAYRHQGEAERAISYLEQALCIAQGLDNRRGEAINLGNLGDTYRDMDAIERAITFYQQALEIANETGDRRGSGINLGRLGDAYRAQGRFGEAVKHLEMALDIARETGDKRGEAINLGRLGDTYREQGDFAQAIGHHQRALGISREMDDRRGEGYGLANLGIVYRDNGKTRQAASHLKKARRIFADLNMTHRVTWLDEQIQALKLKS